MGVQVRANHSSRTASAFQGRLWPMRREAPQGNHCGSPRRGCEEILTQLVHISFCLSLNSNITLFCTYGIPMPQQYTAIIQLVYVAQAADARVMPKHAE